MAIEYTSILMLRDWINTLKEDTTFTIDFANIVDEAMEAEERNKLLVPKFTTQKENEMIKKAFEDAAASLNQSSESIGAEIKSSSSDKNNYNNIDFIVNKGSEKLLPRFVAQGLKNLELALKKKTIVNSMFCFGKSLIATKCIDGNKHKEPASDFYKKMVDTIQANNGFDLKDKIYNIAAEVSAESTFFSLGYDAIEILLGNVKRQIKNSKDNEDVKSIELNFGQALDLALKGKNRSAVNFWQGHLQHELKIINTAFEPLKEHITYGEKANNGYPCVIFKGGDAEEAIKFLAKGLSNLRIYLEKKPFVNSIFCFGVGSIPGTAKHTESAASMYSKFIKELEKKYKFSTKDTVEQIAQEVAASKARFLAGIQYDAIDILVKYVARQLSRKPEEFNGNGNIIIDFDKALDLTFKNRKIRRVAYVSQNIINKENEVIKAAFVYANKGYSLPIKFDGQQSKTGYHTVTVPDSIKGSHLIIDAFRKLQVDVYNKPILNSIFCFGKLLPIGKSASDVYLKFLGKIKPENYSKSAEDIDDVALDVTSEKAPAIEYDAIDILTKEVMRQFKSDTTTLVTLPFGTSLEKAMKGRNRKILLVRKKSLQNEANLLNTATQNCGNIDGVEIKTKEHKEYIIPDITISASDNAKLVQVVYNFFTTLSEQKSILNSIYFFGKSIIGKRKEPASEIYEKAILEKLKDKLPKTTTETTEQ